MPPPMTRIADDTAAPAPKVSVVIPVHGVEPYLEDCLRSVMGQSLREIEIIPVDDRSPDGCRRIIDRLADEDPRIRPIALDRTVGQGFARNVGLDAARGDYVWLLDADDLFASDRVLEDAWRTAHRTGADLVRTRKAAERAFGPGPGGFTDHEDPSERFFGTARDATTFADCPALLHNRHCWTWLYRRPFLDRHAIRFVTPQWEERPFILKALLNAGRISLTTDRSVVYRLRPSSTARRAKGPDDVRHILANFDEVVRLLESHGAADRGGRLRGHLTFTLTQYLQHVFLDFPYRIARARPGGIGAGDLIDRFAAAFERCDFDVHDVDSRPTGLSQAHLGSGAIHLLVAGIRDRDPDLVRRAVERTPIAQADLIRSHRKRPAGPEEARREEALNRFARNDHVRTGRRRPGRRAGKPRIVLHIGASKTGSTYLQHLMERNRPELLRRGIWYPEVGLYWQQRRPHKQAGHAGFIAAAARNDDALRRHIEAGLDLMDGRVRTIVLSSEAFFLDDRAHLIPGYFDGYPVTVVVYLRRQDDWANSQYAELVGGGAVGRVADPPERWVRSAKVQALLDHRTVLDRFGRVVGRSAIVPRLYEVSRMRDGDLVRDFADATGLPDLSDLPRPDAAHENAPRLSGAHLREIAPLNAMPFRSQEDYFGCIDEIEQGIADWRAARDLSIPRPDLLGADLRQEILEAARDSNAQVAREWFGRPDGTLFETPRPDPAPPPDDLHAEERDIIRAAFQRWSGADPETAGSDAVPGHAPRAAYRVINYGILGWRRWGLTPLVRPHVARRAAPGDMERFDADPAGFMHGLRSAGHRRIARRLYPSGSVLGPGEVLALLVPPLAWVAGRVGGRALAEDFRSDPVLFFRLLGNPVWRGLGRVLFPIGEAVRRPGDRDDGSPGP